MIRKNIAIGLVALLALSFTCILIFKKPLAIPENHQTVYWLRENNGTRDGKPDYYLHFKQNNKLSEVTVYKGRLSSLETIGTFPVKITRDLSMLIPKFGSIRNSNSYCVSFPFIDERIDHLISGGAWFTTSLHKSRCFSNPSQYEYVNRDILGMKSTRGRYEFRTAVQRDGHIRYLKRANKSIQTEVSTPLAPASLTP